MLFIDIGGSFVKIFINEIKVKEVESPKKFINLLSLIQKLIEDYNNNTNEDILIGLPCPLKGQSQFSNTLGYIIDFEEIKKLKGGENIKLMNDIVLQVSRRLFLEMDYKNIKYFNENSSLILDIVVGTGFGISLSSPLGFIIPLEYSNLDFSKTINTINIGFESNNFNFNEIFGNKNILNNINKILESDYSNLEELSEFICSSTLDSKLSDQISNNLNIWIKNLNKCLNYFTSIYPNIDKIYLSGGTVLFIRNIYQYYNKRSFPKEIFRIEKDSLIKFL